MLRQRFPCLCSFVDQAVRRHFCRIYCDGASGIFLRSRTVSYRVMANHVDLILRLIFQTADGCARSCKLAKHCKRVFCARLAVIQAVALCILHLFP